MNGHVFQLSIHERACLYCVLLEMEPSILHTNYFWLYSFLNAIRIAELEASILNMRYSWLYLLMNTRCILEMETSAQGFGSLSKNSGKNKWKINVFVLGYNMYCRAGIAYSQHELLLTLCPNDYKMYCHFLTLTIRSPISYYPWIQNTTVVYSWKGIVNYVSSMCV